MNTDSFAMDSFDGVLRREFPVPTEPFGRAKWMGDAADACGALAKVYRRSEAELLLAIRDSGISSEEYRIEEVYRPYARVNVSLLREMEPEVFEACVHVKQAFAEEVLGRRRLYELVSEVLGDAVREHEVVNVVDVRRKLSASVAAWYVEDGEEFVRLRVVER